MSLQEESTNHLLTALTQISDMISGRTPLPQILRALADAAQELTQASWGLFLLLSSSQPPEYYGPDDARALGPPLLQALEEAGLKEVGVSPIQVALQAPFSAPQLLHVLALPVLHGKALRGLLAAFYTDSPPNQPDPLLQLLNHQAHIAIEKTRLDAIVSESYTSTIRALASAIDARDPSTHRHSQGVTELSVALAEAIELGEEEVNIIRQAAILHDVGKIGISERILFKPGPLTYSERAVVEAHPLVGVSILHGIPHLENLIPLILHHHERYNGTGYPDGLRGDEIPLGAQILAIADTFDAMTTERPYHRGMGITETCAYLESEAGKTFHPQLVKAFVRMIFQRMLNIEPDG